MAYEQGSATDYRDLLSKLRTFLTTNSALVAAGQNWVEQRWNQTGAMDGTQELILKGPGLSGSDNVYIGIKSLGNLASDYFNWVLNGYHGYNSAADFYNQPGATSQSVNGYNICLHLANFAIPYWFVANGRRVIIVVKVNTRYFTAYLGLLTPYCTTAQSPYPMALIGNNSQPVVRWSSVSSGLASFVKKGLTWSQISIWPGNGFQILPSDDNTYLLMQTILASISQPSPTSISQGNYYGEPTGLFYIPGLGNVSENLITANGVNHLVVQDGSNTGLTNYFAIRLE